MSAAGFSAVILAGGAARRLGGRDKAAIVVDGAPLLSRVLVAVDQAAQRIIVGPQRPLIDAAMAGVRWTREEPSGGGPVAATAAGLALVEQGFVALLAVDQPYLTSGAIDTLRHAAQPSTVDGAVFVDDDGRRQLLCGVWRTRAMRAALDRVGDPAGRSMRALVADLRVSEVHWPTDHQPPYLDLDTVDQVIDTMSDSSKEHS